MKYINGFQSHFTGWLMQIVSGLTLRDGLWNEHSDIYMEYPLLLSFSRESCSIYHTPCRAEKTLIFLIMKPEHEFYNSHAEISPHRCYCHKKGFEFHCFIFQWPCSEQHILNKFSNTPDSICQNHIYHECVWTSIIYREKANYEKLSNGWLQNLITTKWDKRYCKTWSYLVILSQLPKLMHFFPSIWIMWITSASNAPRTVITVATGMLCYHPTQ